MQANVRYAEHAPPPHLRGLVACGWMLECADALPEHRVLPDGCIDIVVAAGGPVVAGPATAAFTSPLAAGGFAAGIRFRPGAAPALLGVAAGELRDRHVPLDAVWGPRLAAPVSEATDARQALALLYAALSRRLPAARAPDRAVLGAAALLAADPNLAVAELARAAAIGERQLRRRFDDHVGYGPKRLARILRLQRLLSSPPEAWARRAAAVGYADQAHMTRECVALTGLSPTRLSPS